MSNRVPDELILIRALQDVCMDDDGHFSVWEGRLNELRQLLNYTELAYIGGDAELGRKLKALSGPTLRDRWGITITRHRYSVGGVSYRAIRIEYKEA